MKAEREKWSGRVTAKALRFQTGQYELAEEEEICRIILVSGGSFTLVRGGESLLVNPGCVLLLGPGGGLLQQVGHIAPELLGCRFPAGVLPALKNLMQRDFMPLFEPGAQTALYGPVQWSGRLRTLLGDCDARHQVSEAAHAADALAQLNISGGRAVDLVLLDIHMPGQDGLALAQQIRRLPHPPTIVFVTAHADHALSAFELDAVDYLTKPVRLQRLQQALAKAQRASGQATSTPLAAPDNGETLLIQERGRTERVPLAEVLFLRAEQKYVTVRTATRSFIVDDALSELEAVAGSLHPYTPVTPSATPTPTS